ncbi:chromobox protein [Aphelenchoides avenae]|nr:chromobox protein [Aphelenchus avenae]
MASLRMSCCKKTVNRKQVGADKQDEKFDVEAILGKKTINGKSTSRWEPIENCLGCKELINDFEDRRRRKSTRLANIAGKASKGRFKVERGAKVAQVVGTCVRDNADGTRNVFIKVHYDDTTTEIMPSAVLLKECPMTLIGYYKSLLKFE